MLKFLGVWSLILFVVANAYALFFLFTSSNIYLMGWPTWIAMAFLWSAVIYFGVPICKQIIKFLKRG